MLSQHVIDYYTAKIAKCEARKLKPEEAANVAKLNAEIAKLQAYIGA